MISQKAIQFRKHLLFAVLFSFSFYSNGCTQSTKLVDDNSSPDMLAQTLLYIIKSEDQSLLNKHLATPEDIVRLDTTIRNTNNNWYTSQMAIYLENKANEEERIRKMEEMGSRVTSMLGGVERRQNKIDEQHPDTLLSIKLSEAESWYEDASKNSIQRIRQSFLQRGLTDWSNVEFGRYTYDLGYNTYTTNAFLYFINESLEGVMRRSSFARMSDGTWKIMRLPEFRSYQ